jgi:hypothetical protein
LDEYFLQHIPLSYSNTANFNKSLALHQTQHFRRRFTTFISSFLDSLKMQIFTAATLATIVAFQAMVQAAPVETEVLNRRTINDCGQASFTGLTAPTNSPFLSDCQQVANQVLGWGTFQFSAGFPLDGADVAILQSGTCQFILGTRSVFLVNVGDQDVSDIINDSIRQFSGINSDGTAVVQAEGTVGCNAVAASSQAKVTWSLEVLRQ